MELGGHIRHITIPRQYIESRGALTHQIIVHPIVPDQIIGTQPGKELAKISASVEAFPFVFLGCNIQKRWDTKTGRGTAAALIG